MQATLTRSQSLPSKAPQPTGAKPLPSTADKGPTPIENEAASRNHLIPEYRTPFDPKESAALQAIARMRAVAVAWWSKFEVLRENNDWGVDGKGTLPQWAQDLIGTYQQQHAAHEELVKWTDMANRATRLSEGKHVGVFEVWTKRGHRLDGQHPFWAEAESARERLSARFPDAFVTRVHPRSPVFSGNNADLLDTLIGRVFWCGVAFGSGDGTPDHHSVQDSTGRTVTATAAELIAHPVFQQMTADGQQQIAMHEEHAQRRRERHAAAKDE
ncbi:MULTISPECIES: hypothetical protein [unclassified Variovorax]|uniref:hypothetical protein n=1 Tax=unclassified Variovorax TaxID=663243 RepID=UPI003F460879